MMRFHIQLVKILAASLWAFTGLQAEQASPEARVDHSVTCSQNDKTKPTRFRRITMRLFQCTQSFIPPWAPDSVLLISETSSNKQWERNLGFYKIHSPKGTWRTDFSSLVKELASSSFFVHLSYFLQQYHCWDFKNWHWPLLTFLSFP